MSYENNEIVAISDFNMNLLNGEIYNDISNFIKELYALSVYATMNTPYSFLLNFI